MLALCPLGDEPFPALCHDRGMRAIPSGLFFLCAAFLDEKNGRASSLGKALPCLGFSAHRDGLGWEWKEMSQKEKCCSRGKLEGAVTFYQV